MRLRKRFILAAAAALAGLLSSPSVRAQAVWLGNSTAYFQASNWAGGVQPANNGTTTLDFPSPGPISLIYIDSNVNVLGLSFTGSGSSSYSFVQNYGTGATMTIGSGGVAEQAGLSPTQAFSIPVVLSANQTWDGTGGFVVAYDNVSETGGPRTLTAVGSVYLLGGFSFTGGIMDMGSLNVNSTGSGSGTITLANNASLTAYYNTATIGNPIAFQGNGLLQSDGEPQYGDVLALTGPVTFATTSPTVTLNGGIVTSSGLISGPAGTTITLNGVGSEEPKDGGALLVLSGTSASSITGLSVQNAQVILAPTTNATTAFSSIQAANLSLVSGGYLGLDGTYTAPGAVTSFLTTFTPSLSSGSISGSLGFDTYAGGTANVFNDPINVSFITSSTFGGLGSATNAVLSATAVITPANENYTFGGGGGTLTVKSALTDDGGIPRTLEMTNAQGPLTLLLQGGSTYTGATTSNGGVLIFDSVAPLGGGLVASSGYIGYTENAVNVANAQAFVGLFNSSSSNGVIGFDSADISAPRTISGSIDLSGFVGSDPFIGTATAVTLGVASITPAHGHYQFTGVKGGSLTVETQLTDGAASAVIGLLDPIESNLSTSSVTMAADNGYGQGTVLNSGALYVTTTNSLGYGALSVPNIGTAKAAPVLAATGGDVTIQNNISVGMFQGGGVSGLELGNAGTNNLLTLQGIISDDGSTGAIGIVGHVAFQAANTYTGGTYFDYTSSGNGVAYVGNGAAFGTGTIHVLEEGTIVPTANVTISNPIDLQTTLQLGASGNTNTLTLSGVISGGNGGDALDIESNVALNGANTFAGQVVVNNALLTIGNAMALGTGTLNLNNSSVAYSIPNPVMEDLEGDSNSSISLTSGQTLTLDNPPNAIDEYGGVILGDATNSVSKTGSGAQILDGVDTYAGGTTVNGGTLVANNAQALGSGTVSVGSSATLATGPGVTLTNTLALSSGTTLGGDGTFSPAAGVNVSAGVVVRPFYAYSQSGVDTLSFGTALTFGSGGIYDFGVQTASGAAGTDYSTINALGSFTVTATPGSPFILNVASLVPTSGAAGLANFNAMQAYSWTILTAGSVSGFSPADFSINTSAFQNSTNGGSFNLAQVGNTLTLDFTPVPEPSTWALIGAGLVLVGLGAGRKARA